jgi:Beta-galactosidase
MAATTNNGHLTNGHANGVISSVKQVPYLQKTPNSKQLIVDGKPFLMLAGELQNSSLTSAEYMNTVWQKLADTNINTILGCITWEDIEPVEGEFDFTELDKVIRDARSHGIHLVLLWFGSFKNGEQYLSRFLNIEKSYPKTFLQVFQPTHQRGSRQTQNGFLERNCEKPVACWKSPTSSLSSIQKPRKRMQKLSVRS